MLSWAALYKETGVVENMNYIFAKVIYDMATTTSLEEIHELAENTLDVMHISVPY